MIKRIKICDFKSIRELELNLDPVTVLVGRSGSGKSNIVQAIRFLRNVLLNYQKGIEFEGGWERILPIAEQNSETSIEVEFSIPGEEQNYRYFLGFAKAPGITTYLPLELVKEKLFLGDSTLFTRLRELGKTGWRWGHQPQVDLQPHLEDGPILGRFASLEKVALAHAALSNGIGYYHFPGSTLARPTQPDPQEEFTRTIPGLSDNASNYRDIIRSITQNFHHPNLRKNILASLQEVNPSVVSVELDSLNNASRAIVGHKAGGRNFGLNLEQESDGFRRFYAHLLALYQTPSKLTAVFEEPENAIYPGALSLLADEFKSAPRENRGQVILTTHSPMLLDSFDVDNIRVVEMQEGKTVVGPVSKEQREAIKDHLLTTGDLLTVEQPKLDTPPSTEQVA